MAVGDLFDRILGDATPTISKHAFAAGLRELFDTSAFSSLTGAQLSNFANPDNDATNAGWIAQINTHITDSDYTPQHFMDALSLSEKGVPGYSSVVELKARLGIV